MRNDYRNKIVIALYIANPRLNKQVITLVLKIFMK